MNIINLEFANETVKNQWHVNSAESMTYRSVLNAEQVKAEQEKRTKQHKQIFGSTRALINACFLL